MDISLHPKLKILCNFRTDYAINTYKSKTYVFYSHMIIAGIKEEKI